MIIQDWDEFLIESSKNKKVLIYLQDLKSGDDKVKKDFFRE
ncbi:hypothetical protein NIES4073_72550 [Kalymmatonema gypsitolerans NIES-4073]|nr:hypothetical protein NIES4073_72550 [Scytonema sp. NIES-4073]